MCGEARGLRLYQPVAARRWLDFADFRQMCRPRRARDPQEFERVLPISIELIGDQFVERIPCDAARDHVVDQPREIAGQRQR